MLVCELFYTQITLFCVKLLTSNLKKVENFMIFKNKFIYIFLILFVLQDKTFAANTRQDILNEVNAYRQQHGLSPLKLNAAISAEAQQHSQEMADNKVPFGHDGFYQRSDRLRRIFPESNGAAENVAYQYNNHHDVVSLWINSSGHRRNIEGNYNLTGIGIASDRRGRVYFTQMFLHARNA